MYYISVFSDNVNNPVRLVFTFCILTYSSMSCKEQLMILYYLYLYRVCACTCAEIANMILFQQITFNFKFAKRLTSRHTHLLVATTWLCFTEHTTENIHAYLRICC
jgi:hypothetical protein